MITMIIHFKYRQIIGVHDSSLAIKPLIYHIKSSISKSIGPLESVLRSLDILHYNFSFNHHFISFSQQATDWFGNHSSRKTIMLSVSLSVQHMTPNQAPRETIELKNKREEYSRAMTWGDSFSRCCLNDNLIWVNVSVGWRIAFFEVR